jgi:hypothetical protein
MSFAFAPGRAKIRSRNAGAKLRAKKATPPNANPAARETGMISDSGFQGVNPLAVLALGGRGGKSLALAPPGRLSISRIFAVLLPLRTPGLANLAVVRPAGAFFAEVAFPSLGFGVATWARRGTTRGFVVAFVSAVAV